MKQQSPPVPEGAPAHRRAAEIWLLLEEIILSGGFARLSVGELAERLSCSKRTLYELAPSKNELVLKVIAEFFSRIRREASAAVATAENPADQIFVYLQAGVRAAQRLSQTTIVDINGWEPARRVWQEHIRLRVDGLCELIERGIKLGVFRRINPKLVAELAFASISRLREPDFYLSTNIPASEAFQEYYRMLLSSLLDESAAHLRHGAATRRRGRRSTV